MDTALKWPMTNCEACGYNLRESTPKDNEKGLDASGRLIWTDFCRKCGHGMVVGDRTLPAPTAEVLAEREAQVKLKQTSVDVDKDIDPEGQFGNAPPAGEASGVPPDKRGEALAAQESTDPENQLGQETTTAPPPEEKTEPGAVTSPKEGQFFCTKCAANHNEESKIGKNHGKKYREA